MEKPKKSGSFLKRLITALVLAPVTLGVLYYGSPYVEIMALVFGGMMAWEWSNMVPNKRSSVYGVVYAAVMVWAVAANSFCAIFLVIFGAALVVWLKAKDEAHRRLLTLGVFYISVGLGSLIWLYHLVGFYDTLWFLVMVWSMDIGGYLVGSTVRGPKLAPKISPNKTWSGLLGGMMLAALVSMGLSYVFSSLDNRYFYAGLGAAVALVAQIGDLAESAIKRYLGLKDSSNLIPGHGGAFDRIDGLIFSAPLVFLLFKYGIWFNM